MQLNREGTFIARPIEWGVKIEAGKCPQFACKFETIFEAQDGGWVDAPNEEITAWLTLRNKDGSPNRINLQALRDSFGWTDGRIASLDQGDWRDVECQIVCQYEKDQNGKDRLRVRFINPRDYAGGEIKKADPQAIRDLDAEFAPTLKVLFGRPSINKPGCAKPANGKPAAQPASSPAWNAFKARRPDLTELPAQQAEFRKAFAKFAPGREPASISADDWTIFRDLINEGKFDPEPEKPSPIQEEPHYTADEIPF